MGAFRSPPNPFGCKIIIESGLIVVFLLSDWEALLKVPFFKSYSEPLLIFRYRDLDPDNEKSIKVLGVGFGERPFFKRVLPNCSPNILRQILICFNTASSFSG